MEVNTGFVAWLPLWEVGVGWLDGELVVGVWL